jgi:hypothetical protein
MRNEAMQRNSVGFGTDFTTKCDKVSCFQFGRRTLGRRFLVRRVAPAIGLFFLAPLVAEFLLGDLPISFLGALLILAPLYGGGALLIREIVRRSGRGWWSILALGLAYAILEEAFTTQTLFNPDYLHLHLGLLKPAYISTLGMGGWWTVFVLTLHTVWSVAVSIGLVEALVPERTTTPWLGNVGLALTGVLFTLAVVATTLHEIKQDHFIASRAQFAWAAVVCIVVTIAAFLLPRSYRGREPGLVPSAWFVGAIALVAGSVFLVVPKAWAWVAVGIYLVLDLLMIAAVWTWSRRVGWDGRHRLALAGGAALAYAWHAFIQHPAVGNAGMVDRIGNVVFAVGLLVLLVIAARRSSAGAQTVGV